MKLRKIISLTLLLSTLLFLLAGCGKAAPTQESPTPTEASAEPSPTTTPEPTPVPATPESRAVAMGLPTPPDVDIDSWEFMLANSYNSIGEYIPPVAGYAGQGIGYNIYNEALAFIGAARNQGLSTYMAIGYRNYEYWLGKYQQKLNELGSADEVAKVALGPGVNDHQTGLAFDVTDKIEYSATFNEFHNEGILESETYKWMAEHCHEYGFIVRYPEGKEEYYGTPCCPGHFRYVGVEAATYIMENDLCLEEFLLLYDEDAVYLPNK